MSETFDKDIEAYLEGCDEARCINCGYTAPIYEFEYGICPKCKNDITENPNDEYEHEDKLFD